MKEYIEKKLKEQREICAEFAFERQDKKAILNAPSPVIELEGKPVWVNEPPKRILVTNPYLNNYNQTLEIKEVKADGVEVVDGLGSATFYSFEDFKWLDETAQQAPEPKFSVGDKVCTIHDVHGYDNTPIGSYSLGRETFIVSKVVWHEPVKAFIIYGNKSDKRNEEVWHNEGELVLIHQKEASEPVENEISLREKIQSIIEKKLAQSDTCFALDCNEVEECTHTGHGCYLWKKYAEEITEDIMKEVE